MRKKKAIINSLFSILVEIVTVISGLILPRMIISTFGSEVNGLISSITSFIGYITLLQSGVGTVAKAAFYKPLADKDHEQLCVIVKTVEQFFRKIAAVSIFYMFALAVLFPTIIASQAGDFFYTASLVLIISVGTAAQYFFGITHQMLLEADQRSYVYSVVQIVTVIVNTIFSVILIQAGCSIQIVKLGSAVFFVLRPMILSFYSRKKYKIDDNCEVDKSLIKQRWDGFAQAIAYFIHNKTDVFVLTIFSRITDNITLGLVSVYSVYSMVLVGLSSFVTSIGRAVTSAFGNIIACGEKESLNSAFRLYNTFMHILCTSVFATTSITIFSFIRVYMKNVNDANYVQYAFGILIIAAEYIYCLRLPYQNIIYAAGKFKETKRSAIIEAGLNIVVSVALVGLLGLLGVAIGTLSAMVYRTISFTVYLCKNIVYLNAVSQIKQYAISLLTYIAMVSIGIKLELSFSSFFSWGIYAGVVFLICGTLTFVINYLFSKDNTLSVVYAFCKKQRNQK